MKTKAIIFLALVLSVMGCQVSRHDTSISKQYLRRFFTERKSKNTKFASHVFFPHCQHINAAILHQDLWSYLRSELKMAVPENTKIRHQKQKYLRNRNYLCNVISQAEPYIYWIAKQIKKRKMPMELVLLPIVESAFNPYATSSANATGIWQIVPSTGRHYGLKQNYWYDGRLDIVASTCAVLDMMQHLNKIFHGDWLLTIAAYNSGEGRVLKAIKQNKVCGKPTDFWHLPLPRETTLYIPKLLALQAIMSDSRHYGLQFSMPNEDRALICIDIGKQIGLDKVAQMAGLSVKKLQNYNTGYKYGTTAPNGPHYIMVPKSHVAQLCNSLWEIYSKTSRNSPKNIKFQ